MTLVIVALIALVAICVSGAIFISVTNEFEFGGGLVSFIAGAAGVCVAIYIATMGFSYKAAEYKAKIINREYGTEYTQKEVFYASDVINTIRELDRSRVEATINIKEGGKKE